MMDTVALLGVALVPLALLGWQWWTDFGRRG